MSINIDKLEKDINELAKKTDRETFIFDFLLLFGLPKASISRLKKGDQNLSKSDSEILWKKKLYFKLEFEADVHESIDKVKRDQNIMRHHPRFIVVSDFKTFLAIDTKIGDTLDISFKDLGRHYGFFLPWAGMEKSQFLADNPADIKAAEKMGRLYDTILEDNAFETDTQKHELNVFLSRLLFCFFAEDTNIFESGQFTKTLASHTAEDGSDLQKYFKRLFKILNTEKRGDLPKHLDDFPYVNGGLFAQDLAIPSFSAKSRKIIFECGSLNWAAINPDIFGSMIQAVVHEGQRGSLGMHYTSVTNIKKVIEPLFLNELYAEFEAAGDNKKKIGALLERLYKIRFFDPACGSGNFLIIVYKELCKLEIELLKKLYQGQRAFRFEDNIKLSQFYGVEIDDFAHETAKLSLWLAQHQMNLAFEQVFLAVRPTLPLQGGGNIICGNAARLDWESICPKFEKNEIYIIGNPPYLGGKLQNKSQKDDLALVAEEIENHKNLDYISCWFIKAANYIRGTSYKFAFVSTNSIVQGEQIPLLWPHIFSKDIEIEFAHRSFKWTNNDKGNAGIICVVIGMRNKSSNPKFIIDEGIKSRANNINAYLADENDFIIEKSTESISKFPPIFFGSMPRDGGHLILSPNEREQILSISPKAESFIKKYLGSKEFIRGEERFCIWIPNDKVEEAMKIQVISERLKKVKEERLKSDALSTREYADRPHSFVQISYQPLQSLLIPRVSSERREYIPIGFVDKNTITSDLAFSIYNPPMYLFGVLSSKMHMIWVRTVAGRLKNDFRYSAGICYNSFPFPDIPRSLIKSIEDCSFKILDERERYSQLSLAQLYDPDKMPASLKKAHNCLDLAVESAYKKGPFISDEERLSSLLTLYKSTVKK